MMRITVHRIVLPLLAAAMAHPVAAQADPAPPTEPPVQRPSGPRLIAFDGLNELVGTASRLGMLAQRLDFTLEVAPDGTATACSLSRQFRSTIVKKQLCDVLMRRTRLEPARDAWGNAVAGTYVGRINFDMSIKPDR
ncbi:hypothetical protein ACLBKU_07940 [Erythrobacter sp. NE805]|uniref:hypothetical protein n=1 Tax=Erythrobacter sp. NE805 TaxID=3389875 RepID=UPI00396B2253